MNYYNIYRSPRERAERHPATPAGLFSSVPATERPAAGPEPPRQENAGQSRMNENESNVRFQTNAGQSRTAGDPAQAPQPGSNRQAPSAENAEKCRRWGDGSALPPGEAEARRGSVCEGASLAMVYAPRQSFTGLYEPAEALQNGTLFAALDKPILPAGGKD